MSDIQRRLNVLEKRRNASYKHLRGRHDQRDHNRWPSGYVAQSYVPTGRRGDLMANRVSGQLGGGGMQNVAQSAMLANRTDDLVDPMSGSKPIRRIGNKRGVRAPLRMDGFPIKKLDQILRYTKRREGMSVVVHSGKMPKTGYMVAKKRDSLIVPSEQFYTKTRGRRLLVKFMKDNRASFDKDSYLGLWHEKETDLVYLDIADNIQDREEAIREGIARNQISIWDVVNQETISTGGTGRFDGDEEEKSMSTKSKKNNDTPNSLQVYRPPKPIREMTDKELEDFANDVYDRFVQANPPKKGSKQNRNAN